MATTITWDGGLLALDATPSQSHSLTATVTDHPVERATDITDHVIFQPRALKLEGVSLADDAYSTLLRLSQSRTLLVVATTLERYESMLLTTLEVPRDASTGDALRFSATFRKITFADSQRVRIDTSSLRKRGRQATSETDANTAAKAKDGAKKSKTILKKFGDWTAGRS